VPHPGSNHDERSDHCEEAREVGDRSILDLRRGLKCGNDESDERSRGHDWKREGKREDECVARSIRQERRRHETHPAESDDPSEGASEALSLDPSGVEASPVPLSTGASEAASEVTGGAASPPGGEGWSAQIDVVALARLSGQQIPKLGSFCSWAYCAAAPPRVPAE
jgi:hypothetical protein